MAQPSHIDYSTVMIKPAVDPAEHRYPVYWQDMRMDNPQWSFSPTPEIELVNMLGFFAVAMIPKPPGDVVTEGMPILTEGEWVQNWIVRPFTPEELAYNLHEAKQQMLREALTSLTTAGKQGIGNRKFPGFVVE